MGGVLAVYDTHHAFQFEVYALILQESLISRPDCLACEADARNGEILNRAPTETPRSAYNLILQLSATISPSRAATMPNTVFEWSKRN